MEPRSLTLAAARVPGRVAELQVNLAVLAGLGAAPAMAGCPMGLEVDLSAESVGELLRAAAALLTQEVLLPEVLPQVGVVAGRARVSAGACGPCHPSQRPRPACSGAPGPRPPVVVLGPVRVTKVAEVVVAAQVFEQLIVVQVALITELAERVPAV